MNQNRKVTAHALIGILLICGCMRTIVSAQLREFFRTRLPSIETLSITVDGLDRRFLVHVPEGYNSSRDWPAVIMFHGGGGTARASIRETGWAEKADRERFLAVFPEGTSEDPSSPGRFIGNPQTWNDGSKRGIGAVERNAADVMFVFEMIEYLKKRFSIDENRIYITGFSNGASMSFRLARELSNIIAAAAPVAGADWLDGKQPDRAVPLLYITGSDDPLNPMEGGEIRIGLKSYGNKPSTDEMIERWIGLHQCRSKIPELAESGGSRRAVYNCGGVVDTVVLYILEGHGHHWPGSSSMLPDRMTGKNTAKLNATDIIWEFFKKHSTGSGSRKNTE